jgi:hypothetical protein
VVELLAVQLTLGLGVMVPYVVGEEELAALR